MFKCLLLKSNGAIEEMTNETVTQENLAEKVRQLVDGWLEHVNPVNLPAPYCMVVDEEGMLKGKEPNLAASLLYNRNYKITQKGEMAIIEVETLIVGDVVILREGFVEGERDLMGLRDSDVEVVLEVINNLK